jgi:hypothetical protein
MVIAVWLRYRPGPGRVLTTEPLRTRLEWARAVFTLQPRSLSTVFASDREVFLSEGTTHLVGGGPAATDDIAGTTDSAADALLLAGSVSLAPLPRPTDTLFV